MRRTSGQGGELGEGGPRGTKELGRCQDKRSAVWLVLQSSGGEWGCIWRKTEAPGCLGSQ